MTLASQLPKYRKVRKVQPCLDMPSQKQNNASQSAEHRSNNLTLRQRIKGFFRTKQHSVPCAHAPDEMDYGLGQELRTEALEHRSRDPLIVHLMVQGSHALEDGSVAALAQSIISTTAITTLTAQRAASQSPNQASEQTFRGQSDGEVESGMAVEDLALVYGDESAKSATSDIGKSASKVTNPSKPRNPWVEAEVDVQKRLEQGQDMLRNDAVVAPHGESPSSDISRAAVESDLSQAIKPAEIKVQKRLDHISSTPLKNGAETSLDTPSPENVKRSQMVGDGSPSKALNTSNETFKDTTSNARLRAYDTQIENLKDAHEEEIIALRHENENKLAALRRKLLKSEASKVHEQERLETAAKESQLKDDKIAALEIEAVTLRQQCSELEETIKSVRPRTQKKGKGKGKAKEITLGDTESQRDGYVNSITLKQAICERDAAQEHNLAVQENLDAANSKLQECQRELTDMRTIAEVKQFKLAELRTETERTPNVTVETDELLKKQAEMHDLLVKEHNEVIGRNSELRGELEDLEAKKDEEIDSLKIELGVIKSREEFLTKSHDRFQLACNRMINRLRSKMTVGDVEEATSSLWRLVNEDNEMLKERAVWLTRALKSSNKCRLKSNNKRRAMSRVYEAKVKESEDLLEFKANAQVELDAVKLQMEFHTPGCTDIIASRDRQIAELEQQLKDSAERHEQQIRAGADEGALMLLQDKEDMANLQRQRLDALQQDLDNWCYSHHVQGRQLQQNEEFRTDCLSELEDWKTRAVSAEQEVGNLRKQLDKGDEQLADPRKWEHWRICNEWKAHGQSLVEEYKAKEQKIEGVINALWQRMLDFEHQAEQNNMLDPGDCLTDNRRAAIAKDIEDLFHYSPDNWIKRRTEGDKEPEPADDHDCDSGTSEEERSESEFSDASDRGSEGELKRSSESVADGGTDADKSPEADSSVEPAMGLHQDDGRESGIFDDEQDRDMNCDIEDAGDVADSAQSSSHREVDDDIPRVAPLFSLSPELRQLQREYSSPIESPRREIDVQEDDNDPCWEFF